MKIFLKTMSLPLFSAILGIISSLYFLNFPFLGLFFLVPLFIFFIKENKLINLILGGFIFRWAWASGIAFSLWDPFLFTLLNLIFLGLPVSIFFLKQKLFLKQGLKLAKMRISAENALLLSLPFLWVFWEYVQARFNIISSFIITSGNIISPMFLGLAVYGGYIPLFFLAGLTNVLLAAIILKFKKNKKSSFCLVLILALLIFGCLKISKIQLQERTVFYQSQKNIFRVAAVSNNELFDEELINKLVQNHQKKYDIPATAEIIHFLKPVLEELTNKNFDVLFLPEHFIDLTGIEDYLNIESDEELIRAYQHLAKRINRPIAVVFANKQNQIYYNSAFLFYPDDSKEIYNKRRLMFIGETWPLRNGRSYFTFGEELKNFKVKDIYFNPAICSEIHYPSDLYKAKKMGAKFIYAPTSNRWAGQGKGLIQYLFLAHQLRKIMAVWLNMPIINVGRNDFAGIYAPDGTFQLKEFESKNKNYGIFFGEITL